MLACSSIVHNFVLPGNGNEIKLYREEPGKHPDGSPICLIKEGPWGTSSSVFNHEGLYYTYGAISSFWLRTGFKVNAFKARYVHSLAKAEGCKFVSGFVVKIL